MKDATRQIFVSVMDRCREEVLDLATDWVRGRGDAALSARPREETRELIERVVQAQTRALLDGDQATLDEFVDYVTSMRASNEFNVSTILSGLLSFRIALESVLRRDVSDGWVALNLLADVDAIAHGAICDAADLYAKKLNRTVEDRRDQLEESLIHMRETKERELDDKLRTIEHQREALSALAAPVIRVWEGVLVVPLIGEIDALRADVIREKVLQAVVAARARVVLVEVTGLADVDERVASEILRLMGCVRLLGSSAMLVGMSVTAARILADLDVHLDQIPSFTTLHDALRGVIAPTEHGHSAGGHSDGRSRLRAEASRTSPSRARAER